MVRYMLNSSYDLSRDLTEIIHDIALSYETDQVILKLKV